MLSRRLGQGLLLLVVVAYAAFSLSLGLLHSHVLHNAPYAACNQSVLSTKDTAPPTNARA